MSQTVITRAFVEWKALQAADNQPVTLDEFIFAFVPDQDDTKPIDNTEAIPADKIVYRQAVSKTGVVNASAVVYSVTMGADVGDFDFNWIGLTSKASGTLAMIIHAPTQRKVQNASGQQGNVLVRSMLMEYSGAQAATNITTPAETWQIGFTARLAGMDETVRLAALDIYGAGAFFDNGFLVAKTGNQYFVTAGLGYVGGLRAVLAANQNIALSAKPTKVWADVSYQGTLTSAYKTAITFMTADTLENHTTDGIAHYVFALASIDASGAITDLRPKGSRDDQGASDALAAHEKSRNHPDGTLKEKGFISLSSSTDSESETVAATPKAVKAAMDNGNARLSISSNGADIENAAEFRGNLELGSAALKNVGTEQGQLIDMGANLPSRNSVNLDFNSNNTPSFSNTDGSKHTPTLVVSNGGNNSSSAAMVFHRKGIHALYFGLDTSNQLSVGGWSMGNVSYRIFHEGFTGSLSTQSDAQNRANQAQQNAINWANSNCVQDIRLGSSSEFQERSNNERMSGGVMTSFKDSGRSNYWIRLRPLQKAVGGAWYTVAYA